MSSRTMTVASNVGVQRAPSVEMRAITKRFGDVVANDRVDLEIRPGDIHALLGENGAGKTTLMHILSGYMHADAGSITVDGAPVSIRTPMDAFAVGIGMVHQHSALVPTLTVAENAILGQRGLLLRRQDLNEVARQLVELGDRHGLEVDPEATVWQLSVGEQQRAEILRVLYRRARILILDEPTASLTPNEVVRLLDKLRGMASEGAAIVLITHHLDEVMACADRITVLRAGKNVATTTPGETSTRELARLMVGRDVDLVSVLTGEEADVDGGHTAERAPVLSVSGLRVKGERGTAGLHGVSFDVRPGEILAIAGVEGNGQSELEEALFGLRAPSGGSVQIDGADVTGLRPEELLRRGVTTLVPSDRYRRGLVRALSIADNLVMDRIDRQPFWAGLSLRPGAIVSFARDAIRRFQINPPSPRQRAGALSGGNAQRVVLARAMTARPSVLLAAQPSRGLDVGAIDFVRDRLREQRAAGIAVVLISTDLEEVFALADRCYVLYRGDLVGPWERTAFDREAFGLAMGGASDASPGHAEPSPIEPAPEEA